MNNSNKNKIMAMITILNVTIHNNYNEQCIKWITITMQCTMTTMNNEQ